MKLRFEYENKKIEFGIIFRKRKSIEIRIVPPDIITVVSPATMSLEDVIEIVKSKAKWINQKLLSYEDIKYEKTNKKFIDGEMFMYLGEEYPLKIVEALDSNIPRICFSDNKINITLRKYDEELTKSLIEKWYRKETQKRVIERVEYYQQYFKTTPKSIRSKQQKRRWASCTAKNELLFNWRCIMAPMWVLDYIVVHEMCHMVHKNHSKEFWYLVKAIFPNYLKSKEWLKNNGFKMEW